MPADDHALWRRTQLIEFGLSFVDEPEKEYERQRDPDLSSKIDSELPGVLAWLVRGCLRYQEEGLNPPKSVTNATKKYMKSEDIFMVFLKDEFFFDEDGKVLRSLTYPIYKNWCEENGVRKMNKKHFLEQLEKRFLTKFRDGYKYVFGLRERSEIEKV